VNKGVIFSLAILACLFLPSLPVGAQWVLETIDSTNIVGEFSSLALDESGNPHISYFDYTATNLKYAYNSGGGWILELVDNAGDVGRHCAIALDDSNRPHISYYDNTPFMKDLKYAYKDAGGWHTETAVGGSDYSGQHTSIAIGPFGHPHVSFIENVGMGDNDLRYANKGLMWSVQNVDAAEGINSSIAVEPSGRPHISYFGGAGVGLKYAVSTPSWNTQVVDAGNTGQFTSIELDSSGYPHISYFDYSAGDLRYAYFDGATWRFETADDAGVVGEYSSLALDASDSPHIAYFDRTHGNLKYACKCSDGTWFTETVDDIPLPVEVGRYASIDVHNGPCISYHDDWYGDLKYAQRVVHNIGVISIDVPPDTVCIDSMYAPCATLVNLGNVTESFDITITIDSYADTVTVFSLPAGDTVQVCFSSWLVPSTPNVSYDIEICVDVQDDWDVTNDCISGSLFAWDCVERHDVGVFSFSLPDSVCFGLSYGRQAWVSNYGNRTETFNAIVTAGSSVDTAAVIDLLPGENRLVYFTDWTVPFTSDTTYVVTACTDAFLDTVTANDCEAETVWAEMCFYYNRNVVRIDSPPDTVYMDSLYPRCATLANDGTLTDDFWVYMYFEMSKESLQVASLAPGETTQVCFSDWRSPPFCDTIYPMTVEAEVSGDVYPWDNAKGLEIFVSCVGVEEQVTRPVRPGSLILENCPNPFWEGTEVMYQIPVSAPVRMRIFDVRGSGVRTLVAEEAEAGTHSVYWDGRDTYGRPAASGTYFLKMDAGQFQAIKKMIKVN
jgi:hypothetical protein